ncbi:tubulin epsilon and delta complex protein 1 isoform X1 [Rana temporaria]|uniref:tubulin epsilon and delta complex protein 1 isoform X1 n=1 Tax=Rana temporaria TaxID=8407 RepID=UPI001AAE0FA4|nr:tubulin epsilon and delta complex protein 1 isoform X1 [Rana temporaria]
MKRDCNIKHALCALCRVLSFCGCVSDPETFRKAKFNRPEAASEFWKLLHCLLIQTYSRRDHSSVSRNGKETKGNEIRYVKSLLQIQGYGRPAFYELADDGTEGSREILLAFSWLLYTGKILEIILEKNRVEFGNRITFCMCSKNMDFKEEVKALIKYTSQDLDVRYLQWINGRLRLGWRNLHNVHLEKCSMLYKIHLYTQGCQIDCLAHHLPALETELVHHPEIYNKLLQCLESEDSYLEAYMEWRHLETVYWQWMETVFQSASEDECVTLAQNEINLYTFSQSKFKPQRNLIYIKTLHKSFSDVHDQFHQLVKRQNLTWHEQIKELKRYVKEKETNLSIKQIKQEVRKKTEHLKQHEQVSNAHGLLRVVFKESKFKEAIHKDFNLNNIHATDLITILQATATRFEIEFQNLQEKSRKKLDVMTENLEGIVCIPSATC